MKYIFCTLFDSGYLSRGLALYNSLELLNENFHIYIFAFDDNCHEILIGLNLKSATIVSFGAFEDKQLLLVKPKRNRAEYCWTCTSSTILYCLNNFGIDHCTYLDADIYFFSSPKDIFKEIDKASIALTEHHYTKKYDQSSTNGKYCVQFVFFRNDIEGLKALNWWREACITWCYARLENGKFGDQKYLDDWTERFDNVHIIKNKGAGIAPWNVQQFKYIGTKDSYFQFLEKKNNKSLKLIFYHYHNLKYTLRDNKVEVAPSKFYISNEIQKFIYTPYIKNLIENEDTQNTRNHTIEYIYTFRKFSIITKSILSIRMLLKKIEFFRNVNNFFVKSSRI